MKKFSILFISFFLVNKINFNMVFASSTEEEEHAQKLIQQQLILQQQQQQQRQREINQQEVKKIKSNRKNIENIEQSDEETLKKDKTETECKIKFEIIKINGNKIFSTRKLERIILNKYLSLCINKENIQNMQNELMKFYINNGYSNTRVYFDLSNLEELKQGIFNVIIDEGKVKNIIIIDKKNAKSNSSFEKYKKFRIKLQKFFAFPFLENKVFNLRDYEQGLDQINRLQSNDAKMEIKATSDKENPDGYSDIYISKNNSFPISINTGIDNSGNKSTGENLAYVSLNLDNLISINDNLYLKYTQDTDRKNDKKYNKAFYGNFSFPFGYWTFNTSLNYSKYLTTVKGYCTTFNTSGNTLTQIYNIDRVLFKKLLYKLNTGFDLTIRNTKSFIRGVKSQTSSRKSSNLDFYINNVIYTKLGTIIIKPSYQKGLDWFGSKEDLNNLLKTEPKLQYDMFKLFAYYNTRIRFPLLTKTKIVDRAGNPIMEEIEVKIDKKDKDGKLIKEKIKRQKQIEIRNKINLNYTLSFSGQYTSDTLYGTDRFSIGGEWTIRGFREETISGDNGYYLRNDLSVNLRDLFPKSLSNSGKYLASDVLSRIYLDIFYDYGHIRDKYLDVNDNKYNSKSGYMSGIGAGLNYYGKYLNWSLTYAKSLHSPSYLQTRDGIEKENHSIYWRMNLKF